MLKFTETNTDHIFYPFIISTSTLPLASSSPSSLPSFALMPSASASSSRSLVPPDLLAVHASFQRYSQDVTNHQIPRLQGCTSASLLTDYEAEIISSIEGLKRQVNDVKLAVDEAESDGERREIASLALSASQQLEE